jgi:exonuclease 3'-5' domain-containing protein 2
MSGKHKRRQSDTIYDGCRALHPNGQLLFYCNRKKANFYLGKGLAKLVADKPFTIQLLFEPKGLGIGSDPFYNEERQNQCVVCGAKSKLTKHHVVPTAYRSHFPEELKSHSHHDILALCCECHNRYEKFAQKLKADLADQYQVPFVQVKGNTKEWAGAHLAWRAACLLKNQKLLPEIPDQAQEKLKVRIRSFFGNLPLSEITKEEFEKRRPEKPTETFHGKQLIEKVVDLQAFIELWRQHFIDTMQPKFLSKHWSVSRRGK